MAKLERCLVGGTFDRFHDGHKLLLTSALERAELVEVWITSDSMSSGKSPLIEPFEDRREAILQWADERITTHLLEDNMGPAPHRKDCDSIVCTPETLGNCQVINEKRVANGLLPLEIIEVEHAIDETGGIISSSRIRAGIIDTDGSSWLPEKMKGNTYHFHKGLDEELKTPSGQLYTGPEDMPEVAMSSAIEDLLPGSVIAVGDVSVATLLSMEFTPDIGVIDGMTKRQELSEKVDISGFDSLISAESPAGQITPSMIHAIETALHNDSTICIEVDGEEDLAPMIIHLLAPIGTNVLYGQPRQGVVLAITDLNMKRRCKHLLSLFEVRN